MQPYAVIFPGQGSQSVGMLAEVAAQHACVKTIFDDASDVLQYDLWQIVQQGPAETLAQTIYTQPALLVASYALWCIYFKNSVDLSALRVMAGHSLGEYSALVAADALDFLDAVRLVAARAHAMQAAVPMGQGALAVLVGLDESQIAEVCEQAAEGQVLSPANFNSVGQTVVAGHVDAVQRALIISKQLGAKLAKILPVSVPSHCALMKPAAEQFKSVLDTVQFRQPQIAVMSNVDVICYDSPEAIRSGLIRQLYSPVRWVEIIQKAGESGVLRFYECGPNKVLMGLGKRILPQVEWLTVTDRVQCEERGL